MALNSGDILVYDGTKWVNQPNLPGALTWSGHAADSGGANPSVAVGGALGTTGTVSRDTDSNDTRGKVTFTPGGTGIAPGQMIKVTYASAYAAAPYVFVQALDFVGGSLGYSVGDHGPGGFAIYAQVAPASGAAYSVWYWVLA